MDAYQQRVIAELEELSKKIAALGKFIGGKIYRGLSDYEQNLLQQQLRHMQDYEGALKQRVELFV